MSTTNINVQTIKTTISGTEIRTTILAGQPGASMLVGVGAPLSTLGRNGDVYINLASGAGNGDVYKKNYGYWVYQGSIGGGTGVVMDTFYRPGGVDTYNRPDGTSVYLRAA